MGIIISVCSKKGRNQQSGGVWVIINIEVNC